MGSGLVHLQGAVKTAGNASPDATIFFLPAAYRPSHQRLFSVYDEQKDPPVSYVKVWPNGRVTLRTGTPTTTPFLQLDGLDFRP